MANELPPRLMSERGLSVWAHPLEEGVIGFAVTDHRVNGAHHLCRDRGVGFAAQMTVVSVLRDVALEFVPEAVGPLENGRLAGHPECAAQPGIAILRDPALTAEHAGLHGGHMRAAELQELAVMPEPTQVASLGQDGHRVDRTDPGNGRQQLIVRQIGEQLYRPGLDLVALADKTSPLGKDTAEHANGIGLRADWQPD